jgi:hypothetical protein
MTWGNVSVARSVSPDEIRNSLSTILKVPADDIIIIDSIEKLIDDYVVAVLLDRSEGDFPTNLSFYCGLEEDQNGRDPRWPSTMADLCESLATECLTPFNGSEDPYLFVLTRPDRTSQVVAVQPITLDDHNQLQIDWNFKIPQQDLIVSPESNSQS